MDHGEADAYLQSFFSLAPCRLVCSASRPGRFIPGVRWIESWVARSLGPGWPFDRKLE